MYNVISLRILTLFNEKIYDGTCQIYRGYRIKEGIIKEKFELLKMFRKIQR
jgi:hypothetical protein